MVYFVFLRHVPNMFPNYIRAPNGAEAKPVGQLYKGQTSLHVPENLWWFCWLFVFQSAHIKIVNSDIWVKLGCCVFLHIYLPAFSTTLFSTL